MTLRVKFITYLVLLHLIFAGSTLWFLWDHRLWLLALEILFTVSLAMGMMLLRSFFDPLKLVESGAQYMHDGEFTTRFVPTGQPDMDRLLTTYNEMVDRLREERIHNEEQEQLLRKVTTQSPGGVITLDVNGNISAANPAALTMLGLSEHETVGHPLGELTSSLARQLADLPPGPGSIVVMRGRKRVRCQSATFMDRGFSRRFLLLDELTEELHKTEKLAYEKLIRMMSHEVNNTSGAVQSLLQSCLAYQRQLTDKDRADFVQALDVAIKRTAHLDEFMRGFARVVRLPRPQKRPSHPWDMARQVSVLYRDRFEQSGITWREDVPDTLPTTACDPVQMEQVLLNVVKNSIEAIESTGRPGEILLQGGKRDGRAYLTVADSGPGIAPEALTNLFTPFFTTRQQGQGIGLTMVQEILLAHGFDFSLENVPSGGAEFTVLFEK